MRLILASSGDGFLARGVDDDMSWTGSLDKRLFKLLTLVDGVCGAGSVTHAAMPVLGGRKLVRISRRRVTLELFAEAYGGGAWLLGGPTVALAALDKRLVTGAVMFRHHHVELGGGMRDDVTVELQRQMDLVGSSAFDEAGKYMTVEVWRKTC